MIYLIVGLIISLIILVKSSDWTIRSCSRLAKVFNLSGFIVSFMIVSVLSVFPETLIALMSSVKGTPTLGLGTLLGSNVADLSLVFGLIALFSSKGVKVKSQVVRREFLFLLFLAFPLLLGFDGEFSRIDGLVLILAGLFFFMTIYKDSKKFTKPYNHQGEYSVFNSFAFFLFSIIFLLGSAYFTVKFALDLAILLKVPSILIGLFVLSIGACLPELFFSLRAIQRHQDSLALGDILGTVMIDATIVIGLMAVLNPFTFAAKTVIITGSFMLLAGVISMWFVHTDMKLSEKEGLFLLLFYFAFLLTEFLVALGTL